MSLLKEKKVENIELFYDLIFVYAISRMTGLVHHPHHGIVDGMELFKYVAASLVVLQEWLYMTNYLNRFGKFNFLEVSAMCINMGAAIYLANSMSTNWREIYLPFNTAMLVMTSTVCILYAKQALIRETGQNVAKHGRNVTFIVAMLLLISLFLPYGIAVKIGVTANILGIVLPLCQFGEKFDLSVVNFPHLKERIELLVIVAFGEMVVSITQYFDIKNFTIYPFIAFITIFLLFGTYTVFVNKMINHHQTTRGLVMMYTHFFLIISLGFITSAWNYFGIPDMNREFLAIFSIAGSLGFYTMLFLNSIYLQGVYKMTKSDFLKIISVFTICAITLFILRKNITSLFCVLIMVSLIYLIVLKKNKKCIESEKKF